MAKRRSKNGQPRKRVLRTSVAVLDHLMQDGVVLRLSKRGGRLLPHLHTPNKDDKGKYVQVPHKLLDRLASQKLIVEARMVDNEYHRYFEYIITDEGREVIESWG